MGGGSRGCTRKELVRLCFVSSDCDHHLCAAQLLTESHYPFSLWAALPASDNGCYYHEAFLRGLPELTCLIRRLPQGNQGGKALPYVEGEPNFYTISRKFPVPLTAEEEPAHNQENRDPPADAKPMPNERLQDMPVLHVPHETEVTETVAPSPRAAVQAHSYYQPTWGPAYGSFHAPPSQPHYSGHYHEYPPYDQLYYGQHSYHHQYHPPRFPAGGPSQPDYRPPGHIAAHDLPPPAETTAHQLTPVAHDPYAPVRISEMSKSTESSIEQDEVAAELVRLAEIPGKVGV